MTGAFLEPRQFSLSKSFVDKSLRLQMGYGGNVYASSKASNSSDTQSLAQQSFALGLEGLVWSKLEALSQFRFPVETADYFFGVYALFHLWNVDNDPNAPFRFRLSHISSHLVDGTLDTVVGGSSSHYSREFVTLEKLFAPHILSERIVASVGVRYVFHQVTHIEPTIQIPATIQFGLLHGEDIKDSPNLFLTVSTAGDPSGPSISGALTFRSSLSQSTWTDLSIIFLHGPAIEGNYAAITKNLFEVEMKLIPR